jgi:hypothetical protein
MSLRRVKTLDDPRAADAAGRRGTGVRPGCELYVISRSPSDPDVVWVTVAGGMRRRRPGAPARRPRPSLGYGFGQVARACAWADAGTEALMISWQT